jgi:hypothetical protein
MSLVFPAPLARTNASTGIRLGKSQAASWLFGLLAAPFLAWTVWRIGLPMEVDRNEPWNAWFADAVLNGSQLYPGPDALLVNNYPPLSFYITAFVSRLTGDTIVAGRLLSIFSVAGVCAAAASCIHALVPSRRAATFGGFWLLATSSHAFTNYAGINDPSFLGLAIMGSAFAWFLHRVKAGNAVEPAIALMVLAGFVKHSMLALPLAALIWLALLNKRAAVRAAAFGAALCGAGLLLCLAAFGPDFAMQMLMPRQMSFEHIFANINKLQWIAPALFIWAVWARPNRKEPAAQLTALLLGLTLGSGIIQTCGSGIVYNAYFEAFFATAIAIPLAFGGIGSTGLARRFGRTRLQSAIVVILVLRLLLSQTVEPYLLLLSPSFRQETAHKADVTKGEIERISAISGPVSCYLMTVCYRAGKAFVFDRFWVKEKLATGMASQEKVDAASAAIRFESVLPQAAWSRIRR